MSASEKTQLRELVADVERMKEVQKKINSSLLTIRPEEFKKRMSEFEEKLKVVYSKADLDKVFATLNSDLAQ